MDHRQDIIERLLAEGSVEAARATAEEFLLDAPEDSACWFLAALCAARSGENRRAVELVRRGRELGGHPASEELLKTCAVTPFDFAYSEILCRPSPWLGTWTPALGTSPLQAKIIKATLDLHWAAWEAGEIPAPRRADVYAGAVGKPSRPLTVLFALGAKIGRGPMAMDSDLALHFPASAKDFGLNAHLFPADDLAYDANLAGLSDADIQAAKDGLAARIEEIRPDLVVSDGNYVSEGRSLSVEEWRSLKERFGFKHLVFVPDCYDVPDQGGSRLDYWAGSADLLNVFHPYSTHLETFGDKERVLVSPGLPFAQTLFDAKPQAKTGQLFLVGAASRQRQALASAAGAAGLSGTCILHDRTSATAPSHDDYIAELVRARLCVNNGRVQGSSYILTGRAIEAIIARALLFEDVGSNLDEYWVPWVHYVPFSTLHELIPLFQVFAHDEPRRARMAASARAQWESRYSSDRYWGTVLRRLGLT